MAQTEIPGAETVNRTDRRRSKTWQQHLAAGFAALSLVCAGAVEGWTAHGIPYLEHSYNLMENVTLITYYQVSWIGSLSPLGSLVGAIPAGYLADCIGRRLLMLTTSVPMFMSWLTILFVHNSIPVLYTVRIIQGLACGVVTVAYTLYCDEIAKDGFGGDLGIYLDLMTTLGMAYVYFFGAILSYVGMTIACTVLPVVFAVTFYWMPESPLYLLTKGGKENAKKSLLWLRGFGIEHNAEIEGELNIMGSFINRVDTGHSAEIEGKVNETESFINRVGTGHSVDIEGKLNENEASINGPTDSISVSINESSLWSRFSDFFRSFSEISKATKAMKMVFILMVFRQLCGMNAVLAYTVHVFETAGSHLDPKLSTAIFGIVQFVSTLIAIRIVHCVGRKLLIISGAGMGICFLAIFIRSLLVDKGIEIENLNWLPFIALNLYIVIFSIGLGPVPWFKRPGDLNYKYRVWVSSIAVCINSGMAFLVTNNFPTMMHYLGLGATYGILVVICFVGTLMTCRVVTDEWQEN